MNASEIYAAAIQSSNPDAWLEYFTQALEIVGSKQWRRAITIATHAVETEGD